MRPSRLSLLLLFAAVSCSDPYLDGVLDRAESLMEVHPDSSLALLERLDQAGIDSPHRKARFALDYAMALEKNWVDTTNVEIIMPALKHYRWPCRKKYRFLSRYYYARILENGQSLEDAIQAFSEAEHSFGKGLDSVYLIRIHAARGRIYAKQFINDKAEIALQEAARYASKLRDPENEQRMMLSLADFYGATGRLRQKDSLLVMMGDPLPGLELEKAQSVASLVFKDPADSIRFWDDWSLFCQTAERQPESLDKNSLINYLLFRQKHTDALSVLSLEDPEKLSLSKAIAHWGLLMKAYEGMGAYENAFHALNRYSSLVEELSLNQFQSDLRSSEDRYEAQLKRYRNYLLNTLLGVLLLLLAASLGRLLKKKRRMEDMLSDLRGEYEMLLRLRETELVRNEYFAKKLENRLRALKPYFTDEFPDELYDSAELRRMTEDSKELLRNIGFLFGIYHPKFILALEEKGLSELEVGYCCLYALGFTGKEIPDKLQRNSFYHTSSKIRRKVGLGPHDTNLSIWIQNLYQECGQ